MITSWPEAVIKINGRSKTGPSLLAPVDLRARIVGAVVHTLDCHGEGFAIRRDFHRASFRRHATYLARALDSIRILAFDRDRIEAGAIDGVVVAVELRAVLDRRDPSIRGSRAGEIMQAAVFHFKNHGAVEGAGPGSELGMIGVHDPLTEESIFRLRVKHLRDHGESGEESHVSKLTDDWAHKLPHSEFGALRGGFISPNCRRNAFAPIASTSPEARYVKPFSLAYAIWIGLSCTAMAPLLKADMWDERTVVTFHQPVEIPRHVLIPGTYVMKLVDLDSHRDIVQFLNKKENQVIATVFAIPAYEPNMVHDRTFFTYEERAANSPQAIKTWFYPGDPWGEEFIYGATKPVVNQAAPANFTPRAGAVEQPRSAVQPTPAPAPLIAQNTAPVRPESAKPVEVAQAKPAPAAKPPELPKTASTLPLIALLGGLSTASGLVLKAYRKLP